MKAALLLASLLFIGCASQRTPTNFTKEENNEPPPSISNLRRSVWIGTAHNLTANMTAKVSLSFETIDDSNGRFTGLAIIDYPLSGSGKVSGSYTASTGQMTFTLVPESGRGSPVQFFAQARGMQIKGEYQLAAYQNLKAQKGYAALSFSGSGSGRTGELRERLPNRLKEELATWQKTQPRNSVPQQATKRQASRSSSSRRKTSGSGIRLGGAKVVADDGKFLGIVGDKYDSNSISNEYGAYGSEYRTNSIMNEYGTYGGQYSSLSPFNKYTSTPPKIILGDGRWAYLTVNQHLNPRISPWSAIKR